MNTLANELPSTAEDDNNNDNDNITDNAIGGTGLPVFIHHQRHQIEIPNEITSMDNREISSQKTSPKDMKAQNLGGDGDFDCHICLEVAQEPVVTLCGHLFCWPCLYRWLDIQPMSKSCPVCKSSLDEANKIVPLYGRGKVGAPDPRSAKPFPQRPSALRIEPHSPSPFEGLNPLDHHHLPYPYYQNLHFPHAHSLVDPLNILDNDLFASSSSSSSTPSREGIVTSPFHISRDRRETLLYRIYLGVVGVAIVLILFF